MTVKDEWTWGTCMGLVGSKQVAESNPCRGSGIGAVLAINYPVECSLGGAIEALQWTPTPPSLPVANLSMATCYWYKFI